MLAGEQTVIEECVWANSSLRSWLSNKFFSSRVESAFFRAASYLTDPICKSHEFFRRLHVVEELNPAGSSGSILAKKILLFLGIIGAGLLALVTTLPGIALRWVASYLQKEPFIYVRGKGSEKTLPKGRTFSLLSWNICCVGGGFAISDGGVLPWAFRIDGIIDKIVEKDADVNCIYETFDTRSAFTICERLQKNGYAHFYFNIGPKAIGVSSGILIASKYNIQNPEFSPFSQDALVGRTKFAEKGVFAFDLQSDGKSFARIHATHLQHSEECVYPTEEEKGAREKQLALILKNAKGVKGKGIIVTGDLNLDDDEWNSSAWKTRFKKGNGYQDPDRTWGGDDFCARLVGKRISPPLNLDHTMIMSGTAQAIHTTLVETNFNAERLRKEALSDHAGLFSEIAVYRPGSSMRIFFNILLRSALRSIKQPFSLRRRD